MVVTALLCLPSPECVILEENTAVKPFGELAIICKCRPDFIYYNEVLNCERVLALKLFDNTGTHIQTIVNVYMPYYDSQMTKEFTCTID